MLENSELSKRKIEVTTAKILETVGKKDISAVRPSDMKEIVTSQTSKDKLHLEGILTQNLFSPDINAFLTQSSAIRVSFNYDPALKPMTIQVTQAKMEQVEIKRKTTPKNPQEEPKDIIQYTRKPAYTTHIIHGEDIQLLDPDKTVALNENLEAVLPRASVNVPYNTKASQLDSDRVVVSLPPSVNKYSDCLQTFQDFIREKYELEMRKYAIYTQGPAISSNSNRTAKFAIGAAGQRL